MIPIGQKIRYHSISTNKIEKGIVKSLDPVNNNVAYVVFNCGGDWENYQNYTAERCLISELFEGWE